MQNLLSREEWMEVVNDQDDLTDVNVVDTLLNCEEESEFEENYEEVIQYEIKIEYEEGSEIIKNFKPEAKKSKKYVMHSSDLKRKCVELVILKIKFNFS